LLLLDDDDDDDDDDVVERLFSEYLFVEYLLTISSNLDILSEFIDSSLLLKFLARMIRFISDCRIFIPSMRRSLPRFIRSTSILDVVEAVAVVEFVVAVGGGFGEAIVVLVSDTISSSPILLLFIELQS